MNTYRVRTKCAERVNISRRKIKKYVKRLKSPSLPLLNHLLWISTFALLHKDIAFM